MRTDLFRLALVCAIAALHFLFANSAHAQWQTQAITLKPGWNAVYLHVDPSHVLIEDLVGADVSNPISEIWLWQPVRSPGQFIISPAQPVSGNDWVQWDRSVGVPDTLARLVGNAAYLIRNTGAVDYVWNVTGKPVPPRYQWSARNVNFLGFSTRASGAPTFETFLGPAPALRQNIEIYYYPGGEAAGAPPTTARLFTLLTTPVTRGQAFWVGAGDLFNRYFGPFELVLQNSSGIHFSETLGQYTFRLRNLTSSPLTITHTLLGSTAAPTGQTAIAGTPPLLLRGARNLTDLTYGHSSLATPRTVTLAPNGQPGFETEIVLGLDRSSLGGSLGSLHAGILRLEDSRGDLQVDLPVTAIKASNAGLWVGGATITNVQASLKNYARATNAAQLATVLASLSLVNGANGTTYVRDTNSNLILATGTNGNSSYLVTSVAAGNGRVSQPLPLRLILHQDTNGVGRLLKQVFVGLDANTNAILALRENQLNQTRLSDARRITAAHLPLTATNTAWAMSGAFAQGQSLTTTNLFTPHDDHSSNPFLHTYHPDHDNMNALFSSQLAQGVESYAIERKITLTFTAPGSDFASLTAGSSRMGGLYLEQIILKGRQIVVGGATTNETRTVYTSGSFSINRISTISSLTTQ